MNSEVEAINNLLIPHNSKIILAQKLQTRLEKIRMYYTNCRKTNHNVEKYSVKRKEDYVFLIFEVTTQQIKVWRLVRYSCHIYGDIGHKIINYPKYNDMQNMFKNKKMKTTNKQVVVEPKVANPLVHIVDVNMAITRVIEEHVYKDK
jgi:hypothetical protein